MDVSLFEDKTLKTPSKENIGNSKSTLRWHSIKLIHEIMSHFVIEK